MKTELNSLKRSQTFLRIMIFTLVTVIIWVGLTLAQTQRETGISPKLLRLAEPLNPNINAQVLDRIEQKRYFSPEELADFPIYALSVSKTGEEQVVVFSASNRQRQLNTGGNINPTETPSEESTPEAPTESTEPSTLPEEPVTPGVQDSQPPSSEIPQELPQDTPATQPESPPQEPVFLPGGATGDGQLGPGQ